MKLVVDAVDYEIKDPQFGIERNVDSGVVLRANLAGTLLRTSGKPASRAYDSRVLKFECPSSQSTALYNALLVWNGKLVTIHLLEAVLRVLISTDELEESVISDKNCGYRSFNLRVRVVETLSTPEYDACGVVVGGGGVPAGAILDSDGLPILDSDGLYILEVV